MVVMLHVTPVKGHSVSLFNITPDTLGNLQYTNAVSESRYGNITAAIRFSFLI